MAHNVSNEYKQVIYSGDARNKLKLLFNNVELQEADRYCERLTIKSRIVPNGAKIFNLNNFISKEAELILHDIDTSIIQDQVSISIGTLVGNSYEYVPIGIFNIENQPTNDKNKTTIKLRDNSVKFDFNYNAQPLIEQNGGVATKLQILQDICSQASVTCNITSFVGYLDEIGVYDNTITAREYISRIAEQTGRIATINRSGELIFLDLNSLTTWEIPIEVVEKYENGTKFKIGRVVYEDGIVRYETPTSNDDTLFLDGSNNFINGELVKEQANSSNNSYSLQNTGEADLAYFELEGKTTQETRSGKNLYNYKDTQTVTSGVTVDNEGWITVTYDNSGGSSNKYFNYWTSNLALSVNTNYAIVTEVKNVSGGGSLFTMSNIGNSGQFQGSIGYSFGSLSNNAVKVEIKTTKTSFTSVTDGLRTYIQFQAGQSGSITFRISVLANTSITPSTFVYEAYGVSPSINYPSELVSVGYQNLFLGGETTTNNGITFTKNDDGSYNINGTATSQANCYGYIDLDKSKLVEGKFYTFYTNKSLPSGFEIMCEGLNVNSWVKHIMTPLSNSHPIDRRNITLTTSNRVRFGLRISNGYTIDVSNLKIMLVEGDIQPSYISYGKYGIEVKSQNKNMLYVAPETRTNGNLTITKNDDGSITLNGSSSSYSYCNINQSYTDTFKTKYFTLKNGESYTIYVEGDMSGITCTIRTSSQNTSLISTGQNNNIGSATYNGTTDVQGFAYLGIAGNKQFNNVTIKPMLVKGIHTQQNIGSFKVYDTKLYLYILDNPLRATGNTKDLLYIKNGMLYVDRKIGSVDLSTITWSTYGHNIENYHRYSSTTIENIKYVTANTQLGNGMAEKYVLDVGRGITSKTDKIAIDVSQVSVVDTNSPTGEFIYELAEPYTEELGQVQMPSTYEGVTYIDIYSQLDTNSYIQYRKDKTQLEAILQNTNQFSIDSLKTGKILGNPAIDSYDLIQIHDKSKNLLKNILTTQTINNVSITINNDKTIIANGTASAQIVLTISPTITLSGTYRLSGCASGGSSSTYELQFYGSGNTVDYGNNVAISTNPNGVVRLVIRNGATLNNLIFAPMLESGSIKTEYVPYKDETYTTLATNDLVYTGVLINTFDTQIGEEAKEQNVFINGEETFKKWARTTIDNVEGAINLQAGEIDTANGRINETNLRIDKDGALLNVLANNSNIDVEYDSEGNPLSGEVREVTTTTGFTFNAEGMTIEDTSSNFKAQHRNTGTYYKDGDTIVGQYTKDGSKQKDLELFGVYYYGKNDLPDDAMFVAQLYTDENGDEGFGHFYNRGD